MEEQQYLSGLRKRAWMTLQWMQQQMEAPMANGITITGYNVALPGGPGEDFRVVVKGRDEANQGFVAFFYGPTLEEALGKIKSYAEARGISWKPDKPLAGGAQ